MRVRRLEYLDVTGISAPGEITVLNDFTLGVRASQNASGTSTCEFFGKSSGSELLRNSGPLNHRVLFSLEGRVPRLGMSAGLSQPGMCFHHSGEVIS